MLNIDGLITGIDTSSVIDGLLSIQQRQIAVLESRKQGVIREQTAFAGIEARLLDLQARITALSRSQDSVFNAKSAATSQPSHVGVAASEDAAPGVYNIRINSLAQAHQIATQGLDDPSSSIGRGTISVQLGAGVVTTITIDESNDTLQGLADAINASSAQLSATIVNDGSTVAPPYRLLLTASQTGANDVITITNDLDEITGSAVKPSFQTSPPVQDAADASITLGKGAGAIEVKSPTNQIEDVIPGVALDLLAADATQDVALTVSSDTEASRNAIIDFVDAYNGLMEYIDEQVRFDSATGQASVLLGNRAAITIQDEIRGVATGAVNGVNSKMNRLSALGVTTNSLGRLDVDVAKLNQALSGQLADVSLSDVRRLFALDGRSDNPNIQFVLGGPKSNENSLGLDVDIVQAAERARVTAANPLAASTIIDDTNNAFSITADGQASNTLTLANGTYTPQQIVDHLRDVVRSVPELASRNVTIGLSNDRIEITSGSYGVASEVTINAGTALGALGFDGSESDRGQDVGGYYVVDGVVEPATGNGRLLVGNPDNATTAGLQVRVTLAASQVQPQTDAVLRVTRGLASQLDRSLQSLLDPVTGRVKIANDGFDQRAGGLDETIRRLNDRFEARQETLLRQFEALESTVNQLQSSSAFLSAQLASLPTIRSRRL